MGPKKKPPQMTTAAEAAVAEAALSRTDYSVGGAPAASEAACAVLMELDVPTELRVVSAHRTPDHLFRYAETARDRGLRVIIAGAGGAAHLPGMLAAKTVVPVLGVPVQSKALNGMDSLLSIVQMPAGIPVATFAIGNAGAANAALFAAAMLAPEAPAIARALAEHRARQTADVLAADDPRQ